MCRAATGSEGGRPALATETVISAAERATGWQ